MHPEEKSANAARRKARRPLTLEERRDRWAVTGSITLDPHELSRALDPADQPALDRLDQTLAEIRGK